MTRTYKKCLQFLIQSRRIFYIVLTGSTHYSKRLMKSWLIKVYKNKLMTTLRTPHIPRMKRTLTRCPYTLQALKAHLKQNRHTYTKREEQAMASTLMKDLSTLVKHMDSIKTLNHTFQKPISIDTDTNPTKELRGT